MVRGIPEPVALAGYQAQRDRLSPRLFAATTRIAAYDWDLPPVQGLLREVSSAMSDETELLQGLPPLGRRRVRPARRLTCSPAGSSLKSSPSDVGSWR